MRQEHSVRMCQSHHHHLLYLEDYLKNQDQGQDQDQRQRQSQGQLQWQGQETEDHTVQKT